VTDLYIWLAVAVLIGATWTAALKLSLLRLSRASITRRLEERKAEGARWLRSNLNAAIFAVSLVRTITRLALFALVLAQIVELRAEARLSWPDLLVAALITVPLLWVFTTVLAAALARYLGSGILLTGLPFVRLLAGVCWPLTKAVSFIDEVVRRLSGAKLRDEDESEAELLESIDQTQREGGLDEEAASMLENIVEFTNTDVAEIMTPRTDVQGIELTDDLVEIRAFIGEVGHSRIPVYRENLDQILGVLYVRDLVPFLGEDANHFRLEPLLRQPIMVPGSKPVRALLADFQRSEVHMAIVIDEYGGTEGLVTIEDVLEEIVGEIRDEHEPRGDEEPTLVSIDDHRAEVDGRFHIDDLNEKLGLELPEDDDFDTIGGFVLAQLGHVPTDGESFEAHDARFTALATAPTHVRRVGIELLGEHHPAGNGAKRD